MAKVPVAGTVKTRLHSILPPEKCAELAAAFLQDTVNKTKAVCKNIILAYSPVHERNALERIVSSDITLIEQKGENLGERMANAFEFAFTENSSAVMIGTDSPTFPDRYIKQAFESLENEAEIVLGKSKDGGFYLIGLRKAIPNLFNEIEWSSSRVFEQISKNIKLLGIEKLEHLPEHYDVDTPDDLLFLKNEILNDKDLQKTAQKTYRWMKENNERI